MATARMPQPTAEDPVKVDPKHYKVEFENDRVRVVRIKYGPGEKSAQIFTMDIVVRRTGGSQIQLSRKWPDPR
jgi:hypothetical protein